MLWLIAPAFPAPTQPPPLPVFFWLQLNPVVLLVDDDAAVDGGAMDLSVAAPPQVEPSLPVDDGDDPAAVDESPADGSAASVDGGNGEEEASDGAAVPDSPNSESPDSTDEVAPGSEEGSLADDGVLTTGGDANDQDGSGPETVADDPAPTADQALDATPMEAPTDPNDAPVDDGLPAGSDSVDRASGDVAPSDTVSPTNETNIGVDGDGSNDPPALASHRSGSEDEHHDETSEQDLAPDEASHLSGDAGASGVDGSSSGSSDHANTSAEDGPLESQPVAIEDPAGATPDVGDGSELEAAAVDAGHGDDGDEFAIGGDASRSPDGSLMPVDGTTAKGLSADEADGDQSGSDDGIAGEVVPAVAMASSDDGGDDTGSPHGGTLVEASVDDNGNSLDDGASDDTSDLGGDPAPGGSDNDAHKPIGPPPALDFGNMSGSGPVASGDDGTVDDGGDGESGNDDAANAAGTQSEMDGGASAEEAAPGGASDHGSPRPRVDNETKASILDQLDDLEASLNLGGSAGVAEGGDDTGADPAAADVASVGDGGSADPLNNIGEDDPDDAPDAPDASDAPSDSGNDPDAAPDAPDAPSDSGNDPDAAPDAPDALSDSGDAPDAAPDAPDAPSDSGDAPDATDALDAPSDSGEVPDAPDAPSDLDDSLGLPDAPSDSLGLPDVPSDLDDSVDAPAVPDPDDGVPDASTGQPGPDGIKQKNLDALARMDAEFASLEHSVDAGSEGGAHVPATAGAGQVPVGGADSSSDDNAFDDPEYVNTGAANDPSGTNDTTGSVVVDAVKDGDNGTDDVSAVDDVPASVAGMSVAELIGGPGLAPVDESVYTTASSEIHVYAVALHRCVGEMEDDLSFQKGDLIRVLEENDDGWWLGELDGVVGVFPSNYVEVAEAMVEDDTDADANADADVVGVGAGPASEVTVGAVESDLQFLKREMEALNNPSNMDTTGETGAFYYYYFFFFLIFSLVCACGLN